MNASDLTYRLVAAIKNTGTLANGGYVDNIALNREACALVKEFQRNTGTNDEMRQISAKIIASFSEASINAPQTAEWRACLKLCRKFRTDLRRLQPQDSPVIRTLWAIGNKADELAVMGIRAEMPRKPVQLSARALKNHPFAEALSRYGMQPTDSEHAPSKADETASTRRFAGPDAEGQYFSASEHWSSTRSR